VNPAHYASLVATTRRLGIANVARVLAYRLRCRIGAVPRRARVEGGGEYFLPGERGTDSLPLPALPFRLFGWKDIASQGLDPPDWLLDPFTGRRHDGPNRPWHRLPDFDPARSDVKALWELSRWDWVLQLVQKHRYTGESIYLSQLNRWLDDWLAKNPPYRGPNWKCGQEASIRVMRLATAALILNQVREPAAPLLELLRIHLCRIEPTVAYARAQDNNHGTSEAAALFIGGSWLGAQGDAKGPRWSEQGRRMLEERTSRLFGVDGGFSQYSVNYHRLALDTLSLAELWGRRCALPEFSGRFRTRAAAAARWLYALTDRTTGDAPNLGANDGANLLPLADADYRDCRPSVQLAMALFRDEVAYSGGNGWNHPLRWLAIERPAANATMPASAQLDDGGYAVVRRGDAMAVMRYPRFRFRPGHADALHVDLWRNGENLLRDGGSYSYADAQAMKYFAGTACHNTVQFDGRDQMRKLGRFLFGDWLETETVEPLVDNGDAATFAAAYRDREGARHLRRIALSDAELHVEDEVRGFARNAVLRWRLAPGDWRIEGGMVTNGKHVLTVAGSMPIVRFELTVGWESRYYMQKTELPVVEVEVREPGKLVSGYLWRR